MKLFAPRYYTEFECIADKCEHSCCIGWEIDIDPRTLKKYKRLKGDYARQIKRSICKKGTPHFRLCQHDRCPHLNESGLCEIIINYGKDFLCDICTEHPRFYNDTANGKEVGLGMSCEEACRIILSADSYADFVQVDELDFEESELYFNPLETRKELFEILSDKDTPYSKKLDTVYEKYGISPFLMSNEDYFSCFSELEYLDKSAKELFLKFKPTREQDPTCEKALERALAYFIFRHLTAATDENELKRALFFALACERLLASLTLDGSNVLEAARLISQELEYSQENTEKIKDLISDK